MTQTEFGYNPEGELLKKLILYAPQTLQLRNLLIIKKNFYIHDRPLFGVNMPKKSTMKHIKQ